MTPAPVAAPAATENSDDGDLSQVPPIAPGLANQWNRNATPPDISKIAVASSLAKDGSKFFYLGERSGIHGWFVLQNGRIQILYVTSDAKTVLLGVMLTAEGENITTPQIMEAIKDSKEVGGLLRAARDAIGRCNQSERHVERVCQLASLDGDKQR